MCVHQAVSGRIEDHGDLRRMDDLRIGLSFMNTPAGSVDLVVCGSGCCGELCVVAVVVVVVVVCGFLVV